MYIKLVRLKGFRTYKELSLFSFSPGYNAIVGLNGSGKSNVFLAISFVLGENLPNLSKTNFLFKGDQSSMSSDYSAFVEVVFDVSSDEKICCYLENSKELSLKRTFSESRDVYTVNGKQMKPKEYRQFLESINLIHSEKSSSNDLHYVVMQGSVSKMSNLSIEDRLNVFREVVGHKSFDLKIEDSLKLLQESTLTYNSLESQFHQVSRKLNSIESQQKEVQNWQDLDTKRKVLQCNLILLKVQELENNIKKATDDELQQNNLVSELQRKFDSVESELKQQKSYLDSVSQNSFDEKSNELNNLQTKFNEISNEINGLGNEIASITYNNDGHNNEIVELNTSIRNTNSLIEELNPKLSNITEQISKVEMEINNLLYKKSNKELGSDGNKKSNNEGHFVQSIVEKLEKQKKFLIQMIKDTETNKQNMKDSFVKCEKDLKKIRNDLYKCENEKNKRFEKFEKNRYEMELCSETKRNKQKELSSEMMKLSKLKVNLLQAQENFKKVSYSNQQILDLVNLWFNETSDDSSNGSNNSNSSGNTNGNGSNLDKNGAKEYGNTSGASSNGSNGSNNYKKVDHKSYVGLLIDIINVKDEYKIAIEQVLGPKLFTIVVSDISYAKSLVNFIENKRSKYASNVRIVSLDLLSQVGQDEMDVDQNGTSGNTNGTSSNGTTSDRKDKDTTSRDRDRGSVNEVNILPLKDCIDYDKKLNNLVQSLLKDFNLVPDSKTALNLVSKKQNSVTPNGEIFYYNGIVSGGYVNLSESLLLTYKKLKNVQDEYNNTEVNIKNINLELDEVNKKFDEVKANYNMAKQEYNSSFEQCNSLTISLNNLTNYEESLRLKLHEDKVEELSNQIKMIEKQIKSFKESENRNQNVKGSRKEKEDLELDRKLEENYRNLSELKNKKSSVDENRQQLEDKYNQLTLRRNEVSKKIITNRQMLHDYNHHLEELKQTLREVETAKNNLNQELNNTYLNETLQNKIDEINLQILKLENELKSNYFELHQESTKLRSLTQLKSSITLAINEYNTQLNCVDVKVRESAKANLISERSLVLDKLAKINKECNYLDFSNHISLKDCKELKDEFETLNSRKQKILESKEEIYKSIKKLKNEKDKNLVDLVQETNFNIMKLFQQLVPNGKIKLVLIRNDKNKNIDSHLPECFVVDKDENFNGLDIKVSFNANGEEAQMNQLSGGQKTLVSLAFILSLQKLKPTPFYLLDEVDSALDDQYRTRLAKLLENQSQNGSQIVVTTFREQLLKPAQMFYEITNENGVSYSKEVTLNRAMEVVKQEPLPLTNS